MLEQPAAARFIADELWKEFVSPAPPPDLARLDAAQNLSFTTEFRQLYAAITRDWWGVNPESVVRGRFDPLPFLKT